MEITHYCFSYILRKLAAAGLTLVSFFLFACLFLGSSTYYAFQLMNLLPIWLVLYVYGLLSSIIIDILVHFIPKYKKQLTVCLYITAGYLYVILFLNTSTIVAVIILGSLGAVFSLIFLYGEVMFFTNKRYQMIIGLLIPLLLFTAMTITLMDRKDNWQEVNGTSSYEAEFDYFSGEHPIPIEASAGQQLTFAIKWAITDHSKGSYGMRFTDEEGLPANIDSIINDTYVVNIEKDGIYYIIATADRISGQFKVTWDLK